MWTVSDLSISSDSFPQRVRQAVPTKVEVARAIQRMLDAVTLARPPHTRVIGPGGLALNFKAMLQMAKEQFLASDTLRLIEQVGVDASCSLISVRLYVVKRTLYVEFDLSITEASYDILSSTCCST